VTDAVPAEVEELISGAKLMAHLATCADGRPHVAPVWYHYADGTVEILTTGRKLANVERNPRVALSIQKDVEGDARWRVTMLGTATIVEDDGETRAAARRINAKYGADEGAYPENALVRIDVGSATFQRY
jgi:PPOX class probable F420-dependent enzyme